MPVCNLAVTPLLFLSWRADQGGFDRIYASNIALEPLGRSWLCRQCVVDVFQSAETFFRFYSIEIGTIGYTKTESRAPKAGGLSQSMIHEAQKQGII
jgi:hypothetical protein